MAWFCQPVHDLDLNHGALSGFTAILLPMPNAGNPTVPASRSLHHHAALLDRMAESLGLDLTDVMAKGALSGEDWRDAVLRCACCDEPDACLYWLHGRDGAPVSESAPEICRNAALFDELQRQMALGGAR